MSFSRAADYQPQTQDKIIGLFVLFALGMLLYLVFTIQADRLNIGNWITLHAQMTNSYGVNKGTSIVLSGVTVGSVEKIVLQDDASVAVEMRFDSDRSSLLRGGSKFKVNSQLGIDTVLSGVRLELVPGSGDGFLNDGDQVEIEEPQSVDQLLEAFEIDQLASSAKTIVANLELISTSIADKRDALETTLENVGGIAENLNRASQELPALLSSLEQTASQLTSNLQQIESTLDELSGPASDTLVSTAATLDAVENTLRELQPTIETMPALMLNASQATLSITELSDNLASHWLLGGKADRPKPLMPVILPDNNLYNFTADTVPEPGIVRPTD